MSRKRGVTKAEALRSVMEEAYEEASAGLGFAPVRMVGYAARRLVAVRYGIPADTITLTHNGDLGYALRSLEKNDPALAERLKITKKARGSGYEPHTDYRIDFGTVEVQEYVEGWREPWFGNVQNSPPRASLSVYTSGPDGSYQGVLVVEKDGLLEFVRRAGIGERRDLMVAASEGQGVEAIKELIEQLTLRYDLPVYLLHDYDLSGVQIAAALSGRDTKSWTWGAEPLVHDLGINFADIKEWKIEDESVSDEDDFLPLLCELGCSKKEVAYLMAEQWQAPSSRKNRAGKIATYWSGRRAELNGLVGQKFIDFIEAKLDVLEVEKLIPDDELLAQTYRRGVEINELNRKIEELVDDFFEEERDEAQVPDDLREQVEQALSDRPTRSWRSAVVALLPEEDDLGEKETE